MYLMYGWRARIGLITPMSDIAEHAFHIHAPEGVSFASTKIDFPCSVDLLDARMEEAAALYKDSGCDLVVFGCTAGSYANGIAWDQECIRKIESATGLPAITASTAVLEALRALGAKKVAVITAHSEETNAAEKKFLEDNGFEVTNIQSMELTTVTLGGKRKLIGITKHAMYQNCRKMDLNGADVFLVSCMGLPSMEIVEELEIFTGVPVVTSQQATLWSALRHCRVGAKLSKLGKLFTL